MSRKTTDESTERVPRGHVHEATIQSLSMVWFAGMFIGSGVTMLAMQTAFVELRYPLLAPVVMIIFGAAITWAALKLLPDARTIAVEVEEAEYYDTK